MHTGTEADRAGVRPGRDRGGQALLGPTLSSRANADRALLLPLRLLEASSQKEGSARRSFCGTPASKCLARCCCHTVILSLNRQLLCTYCVPDSVLGTRETKES